MPRKRRSFEAGHKPKLLVIIDETAECDRAVYFASRRAARIGGNVVMLRVIETHDQSQQWLGVADIMRAEAHDEADAQLGKYAARAKAIAGIAAERVVREGDKAEEIRNSSTRTKTSSFSCSPLALGRRVRARWLRRSAAPPAIIRYPLPSCPAISPTRRLTRCHKADRT